MYSSKYLSIYFCIQTILFFEAFQQYVTGVDSVRKALGIGIAGGVD